MLVLRGTVVTMRPGAAVLDQGEVYAGDDGLIAAVTPGDPVPAGFQDAPRVAAGGDPGGDRPEIGCRRQRDGTEDPTPPHGAEEGTDVPDRRRGEQHAARRPLRGRRPAAGRG